MNDFDEERKFIINLVMECSIACDENNETNKCNITNSDTECNESNGESGIETNGNNKLFVDVSLPLSHTTNWFISDFTQFQYETEKYNVIVALNSLFYLFNNPKFEDKYHYIFFKTLIHSLVISGVLFVDKITYNSLKDWAQNDINNIEVKNLGGFPNNIFKIMRMH
jgi:hypothetical protein